MAGKHRKIEAGEGRDRGRHVEIDDAEYRALVRFVGNLEEDAVQIDGQDQARDDRQSQDDFQTHALPVSLFQPTRTISTKASDKIVKMTLNATRMRNQIMFSARRATRDQRPAELDGANQGRYQHRINQRGQHQLAQAQIYRHGAEQSADDGDAPGAEQHH